MAFGDGPLVVLLQSDDDSRDMYARYFAHLGWRTVQLDTGRDVFTFAPEASVIVTDILRVGEPDPYALIRELKHDQRTSTVPVVVVTAWADAACRERAEQAGCDAFLLKPCLPDDLLEVLVQLIASAKNTRRKTRAERPS
jgi:CheY-like chemotaxis protein